MDLSQIPFDVSYGFDEQLHEQPTDPEAMRQAVAWLVAQLDDPDLPPLQRTRIAGMAGSYARITRDLEQAQALLQQALEHAHQLQNARLVLANQLRLAHVYQ